MIKAYFDGCCEPINPGGHIGLGAIIFHNGDRIWKHSEYILAAESNSNNVGEYRAFIAILEYLKGKGMHRMPIRIYGDSKLVIEQMFGRWKIKKGHYVFYAHKAANLLSGFPNIEGVWIPRDENYLADELSKRELVNNRVQFYIQPLERVKAK